MLAQPAAADRVVALLASAQGRTAGLVAPTATWQQVLADGVQDLVADVEHDLQGRLRTVLQDVEAIIDAGDPKDSWGDIEVWLRRHVVAAAVANYDTLAAPRAATRRGRRAHGSTSTPATPMLVDDRPAHRRTSSAVILASAESLRRPGRQLRRR